MDTTPTLPSSHFSLKDILRSAWRNVKGTKSVLWLAYLIFIGLALLTKLIAVTLNSHILTHFSLNTEQAEFFINWLLNLLVTMPVTVGIMGIALKRIRQQPMNAMSVFHYFRWPYLWRIVLTLFITGGIAVLLAYGIYPDPKSLHFSQLFSFPTITSTVRFLLIIFLAVCFYLIKPILADQGNTLSPWQVIVLSFKKTLPHFFSILWIYILLFLAIFLSILLVGIPLIWVLPFATLVCAEVHVRCSPPHDS
jgi:hypothetical protein